MEQKLPDRIQHIEIVESKREIIITFVDEPDQHTACVAMIIDGRRWIQMAAIARELREEMIRGHRFNASIKHEEINGRQVHSFNVRTGDGSHENKYTIFAMSIKVIDVDQIDIGLDGDVETCGVRSCTISKVQRETLVNPIIYGIHFDVKTDTYVRNISLRVPSDCNDVLYKRLCDIESCGTRVTLRFYNTSTWCGIANHPTFIEIQEIGTDKLETYFVTNVTAGPVQSVQVHEDDTVANDNTVGDSDGKSCSDPSILLHSAGDVVITTGVIRLVTTEEHREDLANLIRQLNAAADRSANIISYNVNGSTATIQLSDGSVINFNNISLLIML